MRRGWESTAREGLSSVGSSQRSTRLDRELDKYQLTPKDAEAGVQLLTLLKALNLEPFDGGDCAPGLYPLRIRRWG